MLLVRNIFNINLTKTNQTDFRGGGGKDFFFFFSFQVWGKVSFVQISKKGSVITPNLFSKISPLKLNCLDGTFF